MNLFPALAGCLLNCALEQIVVEGDDLFPNQAMTLSIALDTDFWRDIKYEETGMIIMAFGQPQQPFARFGLERGTVRNGETTLQHAFIDDVVEKIKGVAIHLLIAFIVAYHPSAPVG
jgi:hypothetical protein